MFKELKKELKHALYDVEVALKSDNLKVAKDNFSRFIVLEGKFEGSSEPEWDDNIRGQNKIRRILMIFLTLEMWTIHC